MVHALWLKTPVVQEPEGQTAQTMAMVIRENPAGLHGSMTKVWQSPLSQQEVVRFDVGVDDVDGVQLLHNVQDADGEVHDERLRHHLIAQSFIDVHCVLGAE